MSNLRRWDTVVLRYGAGVLEPKKNRAMLLADNSKLEGGISLPLMPQMSSCLPRAALRRLGWLRYVAMYILLPAPVGSRRQNHGRERSLGCDLPLHEHLHTRLPFLFCVLVFAPQRSRSGRSGAPRSAGRKAHRPRTKLVRIRVYRRRYDVDTACPSS